MAKDIKEGHILHAHRNFDQNNFTINLQRHNDALRMPHIINMERLSEAQILSINRVCLYFYVITISDVMNGSG